MCPFLIVRVFFPKEQGLPKVPKERPWENDPYSSYGWPILCPLSGFRWACHSCQGHNLDCVWHFSIYIYFVECCATWLDDNKLSSAMDDFSILISLLGVVLTGWCGSHESLHHFLHALVHGVEHVPEEVVWAGSVLDAGVGLPLAAAILEDPLEVAVLAAKLIVNHVVDLKKNPSKGIPNFARFNINISTPVIGKFREIPTLSRTSNMKYVF